MDQWIWRWKGTEKADPEKIFFLMKNEQKGLFH